MFKFVVFLLFFNFSHSDALCIGATSVTTTKTTSMATSSVVYPLYNGCNKEDEINCIATDNKKFCSLDNTCICQCTNISSLCSGFQAKLLGGCIILPTYMLTVPSTTQTPTDQIDNRQ